MFYAYKNSMLYECLAKPFSDTCFCTYRGVSCAKANPSESASNYFFLHKIFNSVLGTGFYTYPQHIPLPSSCVNILRAMRDAYNAPSIETGQEQRLGT